MFDRKEIKINTIERIRQVVLDMISRREASTDVEVRNMITRCIIHVLKEESKSKPVKNNYDKDDKDIITLLLRRRLMIVGLICPWDGELHRSSECDEKLYTMFPELRPKHE